MAAGDDERASVFGSEVGEGDHGLHPRLPAVRRMAPLEHEVVAVERLSLLAGMDLDRLRTADLNARRRLVRSSPKPGRHGQLKEVLGGAVEQRVGDHVGGVTGVGEDRPDASGAVTAEVVLAPTDVGELRPEVVPQTLERRRRDEVRRR